MCARTESIFLSRQNANPTRALPSSPAPRRAWPGVFPSKRQCAHSRLQSTARCRALRPRAHETLFAVQTSSRASDASALSSLQVHQAASHISLGADPCSAERREDFWAQRQVLEARQPLLVHILCMMPSLHCLLVRCRRLVLGPVHMCEQTQATSNRTLHTDARKRMPNVGRGRPVCRRKARQDATLALFAFRAWLVKAEGRMHILPHSTKHESEKHSNPPGAGGGEETFGVLHSTQFRR